MSDIPAWQRVAGWIIIGILMWLAGFASSGVFSPKLPPSPTYIATDGGDGWVRIDNYLWRAEMPDGVTCYSTAPGGEGRLSCVLVSDLTMVESPTTR